MRKNLKYISSHIKTTWTSTIAIKLEKQQKSHFPFMSHEMGRDTFAAGHGLTRLLAKINLID